MTYRVKIAATRFGVAAIWVAATDSSDPDKARRGAAALFRIERSGNRVVSRRVLWGDPARWPPQAVEELTRLLDTEPKAHLRLETLLDRLISSPLKNGEETQVVTLLEAPVVKGLRGGVLYDVDLSLDPTK